MKPILILVLSAVALSGCSSMSESSSARLIELDGKPDVQAFNQIKSPVMNVPSEHKLKSAGHWQVISAHLLNNLRDKLPNNQTPIYVPKMQNTTFSKIFHSQLRSTLSTSGHMLSDNDKAAVRIEVTAESVQHTELTNRYRPGKLTALAFGLKYLESASDLIDAATNLMIAKDVGESIAETQYRPETEIVLTTVLRNNDIIVAHRTDVYYIDTVDEGLFKENLRTFSVVGD